MAKVSWSGRVASVQPRVRLIRSFDERWHSYLGYVVVVEGSVGRDQREFAVAIGPAAHAKYQVRVDDVVAGRSDGIDTDTHVEGVEFHKTIGLHVVERAAGTPRDPPPWRAAPPGLAMYRERGHRRLDARTYDTKCGSCMWGCRMSVEMIIDPWKPGVKRYRTETFCYGPKSCRLYKAGPIRKVPGRRGIVYEEEDWVDEEATSHRGADD